jgi:hypothetical protein
MTEALRKAEEALASSLDRASRPIYETLGPRYPENGPLLADAAKTIRALLDERDAAIARAEKAEERAHYATGTADLAMQHRDAAEASLAAVTAERDAMRALLLEGRNGLHIAIDALGKCYDVCDYPAHGRTLQNEAINWCRPVVARIDEALKEPTNAE